MKNHNDYISGIPDVWYSGAKADLWVEYKYEPITIPRTPIVPNLSPKQLHWIKARRAEGRSVWVIVGCKPGGVIYETLEEMEYGLAPEVFLDRRVTRQELAETIADFCVDKKIPVRETGENAPGINGSRLEGGSQPV